jgi:site-specific DNA-methyltransferase (adenine-specific)
VSIQPEFFEAALFRKNGKAARQVPATPPLCLPASDELPTPTPPRLVFRDGRNELSLFHGNCLDLLNRIATKYPGGIFDMVFADPPYFLSNGGSTCQNGKRVAVDKGQWDKSRGLRQDFKFTLAWLRGCRRVLKPNGTLWVTGTPHSIHIVGYALQKLGFRILNDITWEKPNPPPNLSCRCFTHSTETLIWAGRSDDSDYVFNYELMKGVNGGRQMQTVWTLGAPEAEEKVFGDHPTQKPLSLVTRCLLAATNENGFVFDPFLGSGTTAIACKRIWRRCVGIESRACYATLAVSRAKADADKGKDLFAPVRAREAETFDC